VLLARVPIAFECPSLKHLVGFIIFDFFANGAAFEERGRKYLREINMQECGMMVGWTDGGDVAGIAVFVV
jgi:hypothetical protein